jgi:hypothetical protein
VYHFELRKELQRCNRQRMMPVCQSAQASKTSTKKPFPSFNNSPGKYPSRIQMKEKTLLP